MLRSALRFVLPFSLSVCLLACASPPSGTATSRLHPSEPSEPSLEPGGDPTLSLIRGDWRPHPVEAPPDLTASIEADCRAREPALDGLPLVLDDMRGKELATVVFGDESAGYTCTLRLDSAGPPDVRALPLPPVPEDGVEVLVYEIVESPDPTHILLIGRVGPLTETHQVAGSRVATRVIAGFDDETFVWGSFVNGWYAMWWPGVHVTDGVAATNARNEVLANAVPSLP